ncbi:MAG: hypothetical protein WCA39_02430 [Nitrososphaeraceae archaeon]|jgi:hypothetical protein
MGILDTSTDTDSGLARIVGCIGNLVITLGISNAYCCNSWVFDITREDKEGGTIGGYLFVVTDALVVIILESILVFWTYLHISRCA